MHEPLSDCKHLILIPTDDWRNMGKPLLYSVDEIKGFLFNKLLYSIDEEATFYWLAFELKKSREQGDRERLLEEMYSHIRKFQHRHAHEQSASHAGGRGYSGTLFSAME